MSDINYNHIFNLVDDKRTFVDVGYPQNVLKTAVVMNLLMIIITGTLCFVPIPFMAPVVIILYLISFCVLNIKYMKDFAMATYQYDNKQIQVSKAKYRNSKNKIRDIKDQVDKTLEEEYQKVFNADKTIQGIFDTAFKKGFESMRLFNMPSMSS